MLKKLFLFALLSACIAVSYFPLMALHLLVVYAGVAAVYVVWAFVVAFAGKYLETFELARKINACFLFFYFFSIGSIQTLFALVALQEHTEMVAAAAAVFAFLLLLAGLFLRRIVVFIFLLSVFACVNSFVFLYVPSPLKMADARRITSQKEVTPLFWFSEKQGRKKGKLLGTFSLPKRYGAVRVVFMDSEEKHLYCVLHGPPAPRVVMLKFNVHSYGNRFVLDDNYLSIRADVSDKAGLKAAVFDEKNKRIYAASTQGKLLLIDSGNMKILSEVNTDMTRLMQLYRDEKRGRLLVLTEDGWIKSYRLPDLTAEKQSSFNGNPYAVFPDRRQKSIYIVQGGKGSVVEFDLDAFKVAREYKSSAFFPMGAYMDYDKNEIYITDYFFGNLKVVDVRDFEEEDSFHIGLGVRELAVDKKRGLMVVGQFQKGLLYVLRLGERKPFKKIFLGAKLRHIYLTPKTNRLLAATAYGVFQVDADSLENKNARKSAP